MKNTKLKIYLVFSNGKKVRAPKKARTFKELREWAKWVKSPGSSFGIADYFAFQRFHGDYAIKGIRRYPFISELGG